MKTTTYRGYKYGLLLVLAMLVSTAHAQPEDDGRKPLSSSNGTVSNLSGNVGSIISDSNKEIRPLVNADKLYSLNSAFGFIQWPSEKPINYRHPLLEQAPVIESDPETRELEATIRVGYAWQEFTTFVNGREETRNLYLRGYNGKLIGPTLVARPGDTLRIKLINEMPPEKKPPPCDHGGHCDHNQPHNFNTTNLHTHGLHVDPGGNSDNVFIKLTAGESFDYEIKIPEDHAAGTYWYHSHVHGATSVQVGSGMAGALIVPGDYDDLPSLEAANSKIMMLQEIAFDDEGRIESNRTFAPGAWEERAHKKGWHISVNGQVMPEIEVNPGELQHWRFIAGNVRKNINLRLVNPCSGRKIPLIQVAADGIPFRHKRKAEDNGVFLAPGYRNDITFRTFIPGVYYLVDDALDSGATDLPSDYCDWRRGGKPLVLDESAHNVIARVLVKDVRPKLSRFPSNFKLSQLQRPKSIPEEELSDKVEILDFDIDISVSPWKGLINGQAYDPENPRTLKLGAAQTWLLSSSFSHHPYHIHVNPFEVIERDSKGTIIDRYWKDTILVNEKDPSAPNGNVVEIRSRYEDYTGAFVTHCHILDHGDHGMMEHVVIE
ncbi:multicopper oxidase family protein [Marinimicrobium sp. C2-29]|uniref:multicopper oxidase family protein n=1 Tax=Marinimicrobium sp. C2-29 TaxID=3139825 RepID=UPI0031394A70